MIAKLPLRPLHLYVLLSLIIFIGVQLLKLFNVEGPDWVFHHLNDFLVIPMVATLGIHVAWLVKKDQSIRLDLFTIFSLVVLFSVVFEYYLPQQDARYTGDVWDMVCYGLGGVMFYVFQRMEK